jgi:LacI family transcriptional regulator
VNEALAERVHTAAARLGYTPNLSAQAVARGASSTVALLVSDIADPYFSSIAAGVIRAAEREGMVVTIAVTDRKSAREIQLVRLLRGQRPRAIVVAGSRFTDDADRATLVAELQAFVGTGGRVALIGQGELPFDTVPIDNSGGARLLGETLGGLGYRGFAILAGPADLVTARDRTAAFAGALPHPPLAVVHGEFSRDAGYDAMTSLIDAGLDGIELVFAVNDVMAIGALAALHDRGIDVPGGVAVAGYDDIPTARDVTPALTTVHLELEAAGAAAVALALGAPVQELPSVRVVLRESTPARSR